MVSPAADCTFTVDDGSHSEAEDECPLAKTTPLRPSPSFNKNADRFPLVFTQNIVDIFANLSYLVLFSELQSEDFSSLLAQLTLLPKLSTLKVSLFFTDNYEMSADLFWSSLGQLVLPALRHLTLRI